MSLSDQRVTRSKKANKKVDYGGLLDALFFTASKPLHIDQFKRVLGLRGRKKTVEVVEEYVKNFNSFHSGIEISFTPEKYYVLHVKPRFIDDIRGYARPPPLTTKQLQTLAYVYTHQPVTLVKLASTLGQRVYRDINKLKKLKIINKVKKGRQTVISVREEAKHLIRLGKRDSK